MKNNPIVVLASARCPSDTQAFAQTVLAHTPHDVVNLLHANVHPYRYDGAYPPDDTFMTIVQQLHQYPAIVLATPVYWYAMSGLLKTFFDRLTDLVTVAKPQGRLLRGKHLFLVAVGAEAELPPGFETPFSSTAAYFSMSFGGSLYHSPKNPARPTAQAFVQQQFTERLAAACQVS